MFKKDTTWEGGGVTPTKHICVNYKKTRLLENKHFFAHVPIVSNGFFKKETTFMINYKKDSTHINYFLQ